MSIIERAADRLGKKIATEQDSKASERIHQGQPDNPAEVDENKSKSERKLDTLHTISTISTAQNQPNSPIKSDKNVAESESKSVDSPAVSTAQKRVSIDLEKLHHLGIVTPLHGKTQVAEQFRLIKRPLLINAFNQNTGIKNGNLIMITSSLAGEGKSFCSVNLAMSIAMEMDHRVLLVDADVARPSIPKLLDFSPERKGLLDVILDDHLDVSDILIKTSIEKLTIISAGTRHPHATELLASQSMRDILTELAQRYQDRIVIFDSPPLLLTSEARVLASEMGQIVLVVEAERTTQQTVKEALRQIESCDVVNIIYNKARALPGAGYYGYYYS